MKQHISVEQLNELSPEQKEHLREMWEPQEGDFIYAEQWKTKDIVVKVTEATGRVVGKKVWFKDDTFLWKHECLPLFNIVQMIEILHAKEYPWKKLICKGNCHIYDYPSVKELCDALFSAVKEVL